MCHAAVRVNSISIHSLRMEGDAYGTISEPRDVISIHSLRMEGDCQVLRTYQHGIYFNPLPPHGGRPTD